MESDFLVDLLNTEWEKRRLKIQKTRKYEVEDLLVNAILTINGELGDIQSGIVRIQEQMLTKKFLGAVLTISIAIMGLIFAGLQFLI